MLNIKKHLVLLMLLTISLACGVVHAGAQLSYRMGSRTVLGPDGSLQNTRLIVRTQLLSDNNTFVWNTTDYTDGVCTEMSFHTIRPTSNDGAYQWLGTVSTPGSIQAKINASLHKNDNSGFYGAGTFTTPSGFVVNFSFLWLQGLSDYQALTFVDALSGEITGITLEDTLETDKKTWAALHASFGSCSFQHTSYDQQRERPQWSSHNEHRDRVRDRRGDCPVAGCHGDGVGGPRSPP